MTKPKFKPEISQPGSLSWPFRLGDKVRDKINGLEGVAIDRFFHITGCDRFAVELAPQDSKPGEIMHCDGNRLELVESFPDRHREEVPETHVKLGDKVRSVHLGVTGTAVVIRVPLHGAVQVDISPSWDPKERKLPDGFFVDADHIEIIEPYTPRPKEETKPKTTGRGPVAMARGYNPR